MSCLVALSLICFDACGSRNLWYLYFLNFIGSSYLLVDSLGGLQHPDAHAASGLGGRRAEPGGRWDGLGLGGRQARLGGSLAPKVQMGSGGPQSSSGWSAGQRSPGSHM